MSDSMHMTPFGDASEFHGKRTLVTGGTKGIGEAIVNRLLRGGATVIATARSVPAGISPERFIQADVSTRNGADHVIKAVLDRVGGLDILIHWAGGSSAPGGGVLALNDDIWQQEFELNLFSTVRLVVTSPKIFTSLSPPGARTLSGPATRRRWAPEQPQKRNRAFGPNGVPTTSRQTSATLTDTTSSLPISPGSTNKRYEPFTHLRPAAANR